MKVAHGVLAKPYIADFGQVARHISDLSDPDHNWFVLAGGQDGWLGSANFADQIPLWQNKRWIRVPLRRKTLVDEFPHVTMRTA